MKAYLVDVGILFNKDDEEFSSYSGAYDGKYGYYDEDQYYVLSKEAAIKDIKNYVTAGVEGTYGIVSETTIDDSVTQETLNDGECPVENEDYSIKDVVMGIAKINGKLVQLFK